MGPRTAAAALAALTTAGVLMAGGTAAWADEGSATPVPDPITLTPEQSAWVCEQRIPNALRRIDSLERRAAGDASVAGSTAWLHRRADDARAAGRTDLADRLERRADARTGKLDRLAGLRSRVLAFQKDHCS